MMSISAITTLMWTIESYDAVLLENILKNSLKNSQNSP